MKKIKTTVILFCAFVCVCTSFAFTGCSAFIKENTTYNVKCSYTENVVSGTETVTFFNDTENVFKELKFNLFANAFRKDAKYSPVSAQHKSQCYPNGVSYGGTEIKSVRSGDEELEFCISGQDENILKVSLAQELFPDDSVSVTIEFETTLADVVHRTGYNKNTVNLANFYPVLCATENGEFYECLYYSNGDPFFSECADYYVEFTLDSQYVVAGSGEMTKKTVSGNSTTYNYYIPSARSFTFVLSKNFECITDDRTGVKISYYYYDDAQPQTSLEYAVNSIKLFEELFGDYPYTTYTVAQTQFVQGGMEFSAFVMISDDLEQKAYGEVIVHETAHQWWQTGVGNNEIEYGFLDEGLAEYSVVCFYENYPEYGLTRNQLIKSSEMTYKTFCSVSDKLFGNVDTSMLRSLKDYKSEYEYVNVAYVKPCIMYDYLRTTVGDEKFFGALKKYYSDYKFKIATPDDLVGAFEKCGTDSNGFFASFFDGKVII